MMYPIAHHDLVPFMKTDKLQGFAPLPKAILEKGLPSTAVLLYALLLDRATLSQKNRYYTAAGWVYVCYSIPSLAMDLKKGESTIRKNLKILEDEELIFRTQPIGNEASWIFLRVPALSMEGEVIFRDPAENERLEKAADPLSFFPGGEKKQAPI